MKRLAFALFLLAMAACVPPSIINVAETDTLVSTVAYFPTTTEVPSHTPSPIPTSTTEPTPGPDLAILYLNQRQIKRFDMHSWTEEALPLSKTIQFAALSPDGQKLAYGDETGLYLSTYPFITDQKINGMENINNELNDESLLFSPDSALLAVSDAESLKILSFYDNQIDLLAKNDLIQGDDSDYINHLPIAWSPDSRYLWVDVWFYEGKSSSIVDVSSKQFSDHLMCYSDAAWLTESTLIGTVYYSGYESCGYEPGVYLITIKGKQFKEVRIYADEANLAEEQFFDGLRVSPSKNHVSFNKTLQYEEENFLFVLDVNGGNLKEISESNSYEERFTSIFWSPSELEIYYSSGKDAYVYSLETGEWTSLYKNTDTKIKIDAISPDGKWLFLNNGTLLSTETGEAISLENNIPEDQEQVFVGWLENK